LAVGERDRLIPWFGLEGEEVSQDVKHGRTCPSLISFSNTAEKCDCRNGDRIDGSRVIVAKRIQHGRIRIRARFVIGNGRKLGECTRYGIRRIPFWLRKAPPIYLFKLINRHRRVLSWIVLLRTALFNVNNTSSPNGLPFSRRERQNHLPKSTDLAREAVGWNGVFGGRRSVVRDGL
jgi:hypothetical protein